ILPLPLNTAGVCSFESVRLVYRCRVGAVEVGAAWSGDRCRLRAHERRGCAIGVTFEIFYDDVAISDFVNVNVVRPGIRVVYREGQVLKGGESIRVIDGGIGLPVAARIHTPLKRHRLPAGIGVQLGAADRRSRGSAAKGAGGLEPIARAGTGR